VPIRPALQTVTTRSGPDARNIGATIAGRERFRDSSVGTAIFTGHSSGNGLPVAGLSAFLRRFSKRQRTRHSPRLVVIGTIGCSCPEGRCLDQLLPIRSGLRTAPGPNGRYAPGIIVGACGRPSRTRHNAMGMANRRNNARNTIQPARRPDAEGFTPPRCCVGKVTITPLRRHHENDPSMARERRRGNSPTWSATRTSKVL